MEKTSSHRKTTKKTGPKRTRAAKPGMTTVGANTKAHAMVDDIGNPTVPEQEQYGGAGDLGTTGAVGRNVSRAGKVGVTGVLRKKHLRVGPGDTGESLARARRPARRKRS